MKLKAVPTTIQNACLMLVCIWALSPALAYSDAARLVSVGAVVLWLFIEAWRPRGIFSHPTIPVLLMLVYSVYTIVFEVFTHGSAGVLSSLQLYIMLFFLLIQQARRNSMESLYPALWLVIFLNIVWMTWTLLFLSTVNARAMRVLVRSTAEAAELSSQGIGGYGMAYGAVLLLPMLTLLSLRPGLINRLRPPRVLRVFPLAPQITIWYLTFICIYIVLMSQFSIAVLSMAIVLATTLLLWKLNGFRLFSAIVVSVLLLFYGEALMIEALLSLRQVAEGTNYALKIDDLLVTFQAGDAVGTADDRAERYMRSLALFAGSPIWGVLDYTDVGKHSTLLDGFARWGAFFGAVLLYLVTFLQVRALRALHLTAGGAGAAIGSLAAVLLVFGLNKHFMSAGITIFIVYPLVFHVLRGTRTTVEAAMERAVVHA